MKVPGVSCPWVVVLHNPAAHSWLALTELYSYTLYVAIAN